MAGLNVRDIRLFRLHAHHLSGRHKKEGIPQIVGACGMQNTPPGTWETALFNRVFDCRLPEINALLWAQKSLLQAWSFRGAPVVFPVEESNIFLSALIPGAGEEWIYTNGISAALNCLQMPLHDLLGKLKQVICGLDDRTIVSKSALDQTLADWLLPLLPADKKSTWNAPSIYGRPDIQTVGGAVVSFPLRPCSFLGLVVFGKRSGNSPTFTSYKGWLGRPLEPDQAAAKKLVRKYLHCYGPAASQGFMAWLGCSKKQALRLWTSVSDEMEPVILFGKEAFILSEDKELLCSPPYPQRELLLLGGHDPYLDQRDRHILLSNKQLHKQVWKTTTNPGAILRHGEIIGIWRSKKKGKGMEIKMTLWEDTHDMKRELHTLAEEYSAFRQQKLVGVELIFLASLRENRGFHF
ncbi:MAG: winged helix DNA-binding domain-containing protein [bacterium]|jgi:hypothetical protein